MPRPGIELASSKLHLQQGTFIQNALPTKLAEIISGNRKIIEILKNIFATKTEIIHDEKVKY